jgi:hypothetical protein
VLAPDTRTLYSDCLRAPPGRRFDCGVATTFTLDLETLLSVPFTLLSQRGEDPETLLEDPVALIGGLRESARRFTVFHQGGRIHVPRAHRAVFGLLEECVAAVSAPSGRGVFHPKLWLLRFTDPDGGVLLRAVVLSRNLTFDRSWDVALRLEGRPWGRGVPESRGLGDLLRALPGMCVEPLDATRTAAVAELADQASRTVFEPPEGFDDVRPVFHAIGLDGRRWEPDLRGRRVLVVSPFVSRSRIDAVAEAVAGERRIVALDEELVEAGVPSQGAWMPFVLDEGADASSEQADAEIAADDGTAGNVLRGLHAKLLLVERSSRTRWWVGSANFTDAAWSGRNVELMVELEGHPRHVGIDRLLGDGFEGLLRRFVPVDGAAGDSDEREARREVDRLRDVIATAPLRLVCSSSDAGYDLRLEGTLPDLGAASLAAWPVTLPETSSRDASVLAAAGSVAWPGLAVSSVTTLTAFSLTVRRGHAAAVARFVRKLPCTGLPADRAGRILCEAVDSSERFFRCLRRLLGGEDWGVSDASAPPVGTGREPGEGWGASVLPGTESVLEELVRTAVRDPVRWESLSRLIEDLSRRDDGREVVPSGFLALWKTIAQSVEGRTRSR